MTHISSISSPHVSMHPPFSEKRIAHTWIHRLAAFVLVGIILIFSVVAVNQTSSHFKAPHDQQEILQLIPTVSASDALISGGFNGSVAFAIYFFIYCLYRLDTHSTPLTHTIKESLFIPAFLRNPFYVFTSIHAP